MVDLFWKGPCYRVKDRLKDSQEKPWRLTSKKDERNVLGECLLCCTVQTLGKTPGFA